MMIFMKILYKSGSRLREKFYYDNEARYKAWKQAWENLF